MTDHQPPSRFRPLTEAINPLVSLILVALLAALLKLLPSDSPSDLHLYAIQAAQDAEPNLKCNGPVGQPTANQPLNDADPTKINLLADSNFLRVVGILNQLGPLLLSKEGSCSPANAIDRPVRAERDGTEITRFTADAINRVDTILATYQHIEDRPESKLRHLQNLRTSLVRISYMKGDMSAVRAIVTITDIVVLSLSFVYMFVTLIAIRGALSYGDQWRHWVSLGFVAIVVAVGFYSFSDSIIAAYLLMGLMLVAIVHAKLLAIRLDKSANCGFLSFARLLLWGATSYFIVLAAFVIPYANAGLAVGAVPPGLAKLHVAAAFWTIATSIFAYHLYRKSDRSSWQTFLLWCCAIFGPILSIGSLLYYWRFTAGGRRYPSNILYLIISDELLCRAALIEIALPRVLMSIPLIVIISRRLRARSNNETDISDFVAGKRSSISLELLPHFRVTLSQQGVLFPNPDGCFQNSEPDVSLDIVPLETPRASSPPRGITAGSVAVVVDLMKSSRPVNVLMALGLASVSYVSTSSGISFATYAILLISVTFAVSGSFIVNDVADRAIDRINNPKRPVAAGTVSARMALVVGVFLLLVAPMLARLVSESLALLCLCVCVASIFYSFYLKSRNGMGANVLSAILTATLCFVGFDIADPSRRMIGIAVAVFLAALAREIAKDVEDLPGDRLFRKSTLAIATSSSIATKVAIGIAGLQVVASYIPCALGDAGLLYFVGITIANVILLRRLTRAYMKNAARLVQRAIKLSMVLYLMTYIAVLLPMGGS